MADAIANAINLLLLNFSAPVIAINKGNIVKTPEANTFKVTIIKDFSLKRLAICNKITIPFSTQLLPKY